MPIFKFQKLQTTVSNMLSNIWYRTFRCNGTIFCDRTHPRCFKTSGLYWNAFTRPSLNSLTMRRRLIRRQHERPIPDLCKKKPRMLLTRFKRWLAEVRSPARVHATILVEYLSWFYSWRSYRWNRTQDWCIDDWTMHRIVSSRSFLLLKMRAA